MQPRVLGCDFGAPKRAGDQARKNIAVEAVRLGERHYVIEPTGRNARLVHEFDAGGSWQERRRGWTIPELTDSLCADAAVKVVAFDFPFSLPVALLNDAAFAGLMGQAPFASRAAWVQFVSSRFRLAFDDSSAKAELTDLVAFHPWRDKKFWVRRSTDVATGGSPPLKHMFQNVFAMTLAGNAMLHHLGSHGYTTMLDSAAPGRSRCVIETYPRAVANRVGFSGS